MDSSVKVLGGLGSIFIALSFIPYIGFVFALVGFILILTSVKKASEYLKADVLFKDFVRGIVVYIVGTLIALLFGIGSLISAMHNGSSVSGILLILAFFVSYVLSIVGSSFMKKVFVEMASLTGNDLFSWGGKLLFWGTVLTIILIGALVAWIGWIVLAVAFFTTEEKEQKLA